MMTSHILKFVNSLKTQNLYILPTKHYLSLKRWIPNPGVLSSKSLVDSKADSAFNPPEVDQMSTMNIWNLLVKSKLPPPSGSVALRRLNLIHKKGP